jgi:hypothetical protein
MAAYVVNCDLINNKNPTTTILGTCIVNVLHQLRVKYCTGKVFLLPNIIFQINSKPTHFRTCVNRKPSSLFMTHED